MVLTRTTLRPAVASVGFLALCCGTGRSAAHALTEAPAFEPPPNLQSDEAPDAASDRTVERFALAAPDTKPEALPAPERTAASHLAATLRPAHPWAQHEPGAWRRLQVVTETFDEQNRLAGQSVIEQTDRLVAVDDTTYTLATERVVSLAGRSASRPTETRRLSLLTDRTADGEPLEVTQAGRSSISVGEMVVPCQTWSIRQPTANGIQEETLHTSREAAPLVLRRVQQSTVDETETARRIYSVLRRDQPALVGDVLLTSWRAAETTAQIGGARNESYGVYAEAIPGGLLNESITETDATGRRTRWTVSELVAAGGSPDESIAYRHKEPGGAAVEVEVRPRRLLRLLRRGADE